MGELFNTIIVQPMLNALLWLYSVLGNQYWLAIILFTVVIRLIMTPLMLPQQRSAKKMQELQPQLKEIQKKYAKDREALAREQMKLYKQAGVSPLGGCLPMLVQLPIWIGLWQSINQTLGHQPLNLLGLSQNIYPFLQRLWADVPLDRFFLGMDLSLTPQQIGFVAYLLPILVAFTSWWQSKMMTPATVDPQTASTNRTMTLMMPLLFGFISLSFSTGLSFYFLVSNIIGIVSQGFISGWGGLKFWQGWRMPGMRGGAAAPTSSQASTTSQVAAEASDGQKGIQSGSKDSRKKKRRRKR